MAENQHTIYFELRDSLGGPGCAVCACAAEYTAVF